MSKIVIFGIGRGANVATRYFSDDTSHEVVAYTVDDRYAEQKDFMGRPVIPFSRIEQEITPAEAEMFILLGFERSNGHLLGHHETGAVQIQIGLVVNGNARISI